MPPTLRGRIDRVGFGCQNKLFSRSHAGFDCVRNCSDSCYKLSMAKSPLGSSRGFTLGDIPHVKAFANPAKTPIKATDVADPTLRNFLGQALVWVVRRLAPYVRNVGR